MEGLVDEAKAAQGGGGPAPAARRDPGRAGPGRRPVRSAPGTDFLAAGR
jgi:hypothetical protein